MKGRIIGREGRNIRAFEKATGVDVIIDDTPGVVIVSAFDPVRREIARKSLNKLIADGRIHPSRIEELVAETQNEIDQQIKRYGDEAVQETQVRGLNERVMNLLGRLHYRTSYSQNVLRHSIEVAFVAGMIAEEMGMNADLARRAGLLHDIGKAADHDTEGGHPQIGADLLKRYGEGAGSRARRAWAITTISAPTCRTPCSSPRPMPAAHPARCPPGNARPLHQADAGAGNDRHRFPGRGAGVRDPGRPRSARHRQHAAHDRRDRPPRSAATSPARLRSSSRYPGEIKVTMIRESRFTETAK